MVGPDDVNLEDLISGSDKSTGMEGYGLKEVFKKVYAEGVVYLDDQGRCLVKCPASDGNRSICAVYPMPSKKGGSEMVCSGPLVREYTSSSSPDVGVKRSDLAPHESCRYCPSGEGRSGDDEDGGLLGGVL
ncbi:hypothetical protein [Haloarcula marismortui]|uniref:Uncharacterized protein n=1 Tax=Haloarcula marismortui ATCC 33800 TaxID=662476 RepID=A0A8T8KAE1_9EURY|nr:hypothetical protein [Haloarcula sinaiiensis]QUJ71938.1 hypothetical protein KDQ40_14790 [Haloarcula sinaiiensis ATCC 33800]